MGCRRHYPQDLPAGGRQGNAGARNREDALSRRALVTGGAGFIGSHVAEALLASDHDVVIVDDLSTGKPANVPSAARFQHLDIRSPEAALLVREGRFDTLFMLAAQMDVRLSVADPVADASRNVIGMLNLLEAARHASHPPRVIFSSTGGAIYGDASVPPSAEEHAKNPESPYGVSKLSVEYYLSYYARTHGLDTVVLRYANVYGPRQDPHGEAGVVAIFCQRLLDARSLTVFGTGRQTRDYVFVADVAAANVLASNVPLADVKRLDDRAFNIGTGVPTSVLDLAESLQRASGVDVPVEFAPKRAGEQEHSSLKIEKAARILGWKPKVQLEEGLAATYSWFKQPS
jgi:UDP-glucose 4-epimerase